jgi:hypothetical protein
VPGGHNEDANSVAALPGSPVDSSGALMPKMRHEICGFPVIGL